MSAWHRVVLALLLVMGMPAMATTHVPRTEVHIEHKGIVMHVRVRTPAQIRAFYEARGFPQAALDLLARSCFLSVGIVNGSRQIVWLEPARFDISTEDHGRRRPLELRDHRWWQARWSSLAVDKPQQATFGWTLLPLSRDLRPDEPVGGNIVIERVSGPVFITARFDLGRERLGGRFLLQLPPLVCKSD